MLKKLASDTAVYGLSSIGARLLNYALVPLHTSILQTESYGIVAEFYSWAAILNILFMYGMETAYFRFVSKKEADAEKVFNAALSAMICSSLLFSGLMAVFSNEIAETMGYAGSGNYVRWFAYLLGIDAVVSIPFARMRHENKAKKFAAAKIINIVINVGLNFFFLKTCADIYKGDSMPFLKPLIDSFYDPNLGLGYAFLANLIANFFFLPMLYRSFARFRFSLDWPTLRPMLMYAYPLIFTGIAFTINELSDRLLLKYWLPDGFYPGRSSLAAVGIYSACYKLSIFISLGTQAFRFAAEPFFFKQAEDSKKSPAVFAKVMKYFFIVLLIMFAGVSLNIDWLQLLFLRQAEYREGIRIVPFLLLANVFLGVYYSLAVWYKVTDKTHYGAIIGGIGALITLSANLLLIPVWGYMGSALATLACYFGICAISYVIGQKHYPIPYDLPSAAFYLSVSGLLVWFSFYLPDKGFLFSFLIKNALLLGFIGLVWVRERRVL